MYIGITCDLANERQNKINVYKLFWNPNATINAAE